MTSHAKRIQWIDIVKYICIMWVMLSHLESNTRFLRVFYNPFFLNAFFFASGYVYFHKNGFKLFFIKKIRGLFIPWLFFSVFNILLSQILSFNDHSSLIYELKWNFLQIREKGDGVWFVAALFIAFIPFYFFVKTYEKSQKQAKDTAFFIFKSFALSFLSTLYCKHMDPNILPWGTNTLPWHIEYIFIAMFWMVLGYLFRTKYETISDKRINNISLVIIFSIYAAMQYIPYIANLEIKNSILYTYASAFLGVLSIIYLSKKITPNKYMLYIGQNTLICFALHGKIYSILQTIIKKAVSEAYSIILANTMTSSIFSIILTIVISIILIIPIYIINRWFPFLIGRKKK